MEEMNMVKEISWDKEFETLCGFSHVEVKRILRFLKEQNDNIEVDEIFDELSRFYDNYKFQTYTTKKLFHPQLTLKLLQELYNHREFPQLRAATRREVTQILKELSDSHVEAIRNREPIPLNLTDKATSL
jgi:hypothetical protein